MKTKPPLDTPRYGPAQHHSNTLHGLDDLCKQYINDSMSVLELGSYWGSSTSLLCYYAKDVVSIDARHTPEIQELEERVDNLLFKHGYFHTILDKMKLSSCYQFDLIYIDGEHDYTPVKKDIEESLPLLRHGGFMSGHDFDPQAYPGVEQAVREIFPNTEIEIFADTSWLIKTNG